MSVARGYPTCTHFVNKFRSNPRSMLSTELVIGNIVRRVLHIIREEMDAEQDGFEEEPDPVVPSVKDQTPAAMGGLSRAFR